MGLHLVEFTWFHYALPKKPYILSVALVLTSRWTGVTRYDALWCPDFPPAIAGRRRSPDLGWPHNTHYLCRGATPYSSIFIFNRRAQYHGGLMKKMTTALLILFSFALVSCGDKSKSGGGSSGFSTSAYSSGDSQVNFITRAVTSGGVTRSISRANKSSVRLQHRLDNNRFVQLIQLNRFIAPQLLRKSSRVIVVKTNKVIMGSTHRVITVNPNRVLMAKTN
jgi:hypothetical protein